MKVALLHYWLTNIRGGEKVFLEICGMFPDADIFTHVISPRIREKYFPGRRIHTSFINSLPFAEKLYKNYMPLMFKAAQTWDFSGYDLIISSESGPVKGIKKPEAARHICYCHTPARYIWDMFDDYYQAAPWYKKCAMKLLRNYLRKQDLYSAKSVDDFIVNSNFIKERVKRIYNRDAKVIYPPVAVGFFRQKKHGHKADYYLLAGELVDYKRPDIAVETFNLSDKELIVAGSGERLDYLKSIANSNIIFTGRVSDEKLRELFSNAKALIFPGIEDFGIVPLEAQAAGTPVIAYGRGGILETVIDGETGLFFHEQTSEALNDTVNRFENMKITLDSPKIELHIRKFSRERFQNEFSSFIRP